MATEQDIGAPPESSLRRISEPAVQTACFAAAIVLLVWAVLLHAAIEARQSELRKGRDDVGVLVRTLEAHSTSVLEQAELLLDRSTDFLVRTMRPDETGGYGILDYMSDAMLEVPEISGLGVIGEDGIIRQAIIRTRDGTFEAVGYAMDVRDRDYFQILSALEPYDMFVGLPIRSRAGGQWVIPVSRAARDGQGRLLGGMVALIDLDTFVGLFEEVRGTAGVVAMIRDDGAILARAPFEPEKLGQVGVSPALPSLADLLAAEGPTVTTAVTEGDDERLVAVHPSKRHPIRLAASVRIADVLADWRAAVRVDAAIGIGIAAIVFILAWALRGQWERRRRADAELVGSRQALVQSLERFERAVAASTAALWEHDFSTGRVWLSPQWEAMFGWGGGAGQTIDNWRDAIHPADRDHVLRSLREHLEQKVPFEVEYRLRASDGRWRWVRSRGQASWDAAGRATVMSGTTLDVTQRRADADRLELALEATNEGLWDWDLGARHLFLSPRWKTLLGYPPDHPLEGSWRSVLAIVHPDDRSEVYHVVRRFLAGSGDLGEVEIRLRRADGTWAWGRLAAKITERGPWGQPLRVVGTLKDVTRRRAELAQLREAKETAELASRAKSEFLANTSHELRTPLNAIVGFSEGLESGIFGSLNHKQMEYVRDIRVSAEHLTALINDILDMAKIESGRDELHEGAVDVGATILAKMQMVRQRAEQKGIALVDDLEPLPRYRLDERKFGQMVLNLLSNAVKFTGAGGTVTVRAAQEADGTLSVAVADTGIGIPRQDIDRVLEPFTQVDSRLSRHYEGTGLGLPLVKAMAALHGATLSLESEVGRGTVALLSFPAERRIGQRPAAPAEMPVEG